MSAATFCSFRLDGIDLSEREVHDALRHGSANPPLRGRSTQRIRNHASLLLHIDGAARGNETLTADTLLRWYTAMAAGLTPVAPPGSMLERLDVVARAVSSPQTRLGPALQDIARLHARLLRDPLFPGFNGILARLLLRYHLRRAGLPPVRFDPATDTPHLLDETMLHARLIELLDEAFDRMLRGEADGA